MTQNKVQKPVCLTSNNEMIELSGITYNVHDSLPTFDRGH